jgi:hypothetical protein
VDATEWPTANDLDSMLTVVCTASADPRKMRLLAAAFSRHGGAFASDHEWQRLLVCVERMADGGQIEPDLGQKLREAGIDDGRLLAHCDGTSLHVRGCWALDLLIPVGARRP